MPKLSDEEKEARRQRIAADPIRLEVVAQIQKLGWTAADLSRNVTTVPLSHDTAKRYMDGSNDVSAHILTGILLALGWDGKQWWKKIRKNAE